jgi:Relaxase/Mobilisation nuclease domain
LISNITKGSNFGGLLRYLLHESKQPQIVAPYMLGNNALDLAREFNQIANLRPTTQLPVRHISLSFAPEDDGKLSDLDREAIVVRVVAQMGYEDCQFIGINHHRDDPGHDLPHDHDHLHIVVNAVNLHGERVSDSWDRWKIQPILREIERDFGLKQVKNSWELDRERSERAKHQVPSEISELVKDSLEQCPDLETWLDRLEESQIDVRFALRKDDKVNGITYLQDGKAYKGSEIGASWGAVKERIPTTPADIPLILAANAKSQEHRIDLGALDRQNFDRAAMMANLALKTKGRDRLKTGRLDIKRDGKTLTAYRLRPHRQILKAIETQKGWEPLGYPNIDRQDLNLLAKISGYKDEPAPIFEEKDRLEDTSEVYPNAETEARPERDPIHEEIDRYPLADYQERPAKAALTLSNQTFATLPETAIRRVLPDEIEFDVEELVEKIKQSFADTLERLQQDNLEYSQKLESTFGALRSGKQPEPKVEVETIDSPQLEAVDVVERDRELPKQDSIAVSLQQLIDLKNYYLKSPEGKARSESIDAQKKFNRYKLQISKDGKSVTNNPDLKMTNEFFEDFKSDKVTLLPEDRANLEAANTFAVEQAQVALETRQKSERQPKQRSRGFSR